ncbi:MAG: site-specific integrase [Candidatus Micrarchaeales archaeon]|nr:site-specific integrase [Candidatus Micrarchaeales archaeon]
MNLLPQKKMDRLRIELLKAYKKRYKKSGTLKYGTLNKSFTELELQHFLRNVPNDKFRLLFKYQAYLGLRIGEVTKLHISNIDFEKRELILTSEKTNKSDSLRIPHELFQETIEFIQKNKEQLIKSKGSIFFKDNDNNRNDVLYIDKNYVRKVFRETIIKTGLDYTYAVSDESLYGRKARTLHRLTTHSLRHYAITHFAKATNGNVVLTCRFARHSGPAMTMHYISRNNEELYKNIDKAFDMEELNNLSKSYRGAK